MPVESTQEELLTAIQKNLEGKEKQISNLPADDVRRYVNAFVLHADTNEPNGLEPHGIIGEAMDLLSFCKTRKKGSINIRVLNPELSKCGDSPYSVLQTCMVDQPFLLDTLRMTLENLGIEEYRCHHPVLEVERSNQGVITAMGALAGRPKESWLHFKLDRQDDNTLETLRVQATKRLKQALIVVADHRRMLRRVTATANDILIISGEQPHRTTEIDEINRFLAWLRDDNFIFLGFEEYKANRTKKGDIELTSTDTRLGIYQDAIRESDQAPIPTAAAEWLKGDNLLCIVKDGIDSQIHRSAKLDTLLVRHLDEDGDVSAIRVISGLFTRKALNQAAQDIPILSQKLSLLFEQTGTELGSHTQKAMVAAYNSLPVEYLFVAEQASIRQAMRLIIDSEFKKEAQIVLRRDPSGRSAFALMSLTRESYNERVLTAISSHLQETLGAPYLDKRIFFGEHENVVLSFFLTAEEKLNVDVDIPKLQAHLKSLARTWDDDFVAAMKEEISGLSSELLRRYRKNLSETYRLRTPPREATKDVLALEALRTSGDLQFRVATDPENSSACFLKIYLDTAIPLTDSVPILDNFGMRVLEQISTDINLDGGSVLTIDTFRVQTEEEQDAHLVDRGEDLAVALRRVLTGQMENDYLNRLLLKAGLKAREVDIVRAYINCARQIEESFSLGSSRRVWVNHPEAAKALIQLHHVKFDPTLEFKAPLTREAALESCHNALKSYLNKVESSAEDRVLRTIWNLVDASLRTNFYRLPTRPYLSFKLDSGKVTHMPSPRPHREIYVHHPRVEGMHLRGGTIARGGLRWSDRFDDYRTEVLGLMRTQMVKNTVIVPVGSKGGFVLKTNYATWEEKRAAADNMYKIFISGLLDLTDNLVEGTVVPPTGVLRYDDDDPYLVVAADKGTAHLSDTANGISLDFGFWLGDAFASGGSVGYDHKVEGITARGAWVCVKRLFQEDGKNPETDVITVSGVGDMSGDVFGNGLLLSKTVKLQAVFNHMNIFFDPDPDPTASWIERKRLFDLPRSSWENYDKSLISKGGGIYKRTAKAIPLSPEVQAILGVDADSLSGDQAVKAILKMKVDLLWNGGIGTYARATHETDQDANDRVNNPVRVTALELGARVIGEGGNLGFTQAARVEFALAGGRINTDFVDNSAGVDMSDHEVNLKLLFGPLVHEGKMTMAERNSTLAQMTDEVSDAVLEDNFSQSRAISLDKIRSDRDPTPFISLMDDLHRSGVAKRKAENLPSARALKERRLAGKGLTRPELATLLAFTKMRVYKWLLEDERISGDLINRYLFNYFPKAVQTGFGEAVHSHPLKKEIIATVLTTRIVDNASCTFFQEIWEDTTYSVPEVAMAYLVTAEMLGSTQLEQKLADMEGSVESKVLYEARISIEDALSRLTRRMLRRRFDVFNPDAVVGRYTADFRDLNFTLVDVLPKAALDLVVKARQNLESVGLPKALAQEIATFPHLASGGDIAILTEESGLDIASSAWLYHAVGESAHTRSAMDLAQPQAGADRWEKTAIHVIRGKLIDAQYNIALNVAKRHKPEQVLKDTFDQYFSEREGLINRVQSIESQIRASKGQGLAAATVIAEAIDDLAMAL